jgi:hypothetical protein
MSAEGAAQLMDPISTGPPGLNSKFNSGFPALTGGAIDCRRFAALASSLNTVILLNTV